MNFKVLFNNVPTINLKYPIVITQECKGMLQSNTMSTSVMYGWFYLHGISVCCELLLRALFPELGKQQFVPNGLHYVFSTQSKHITSKYSSEQFFPLLQLGFFVCLFKLHSFSYLTLLILTVAIILTFYEIFL